jgi:signal transduction histidine kinase
MITDRLSQKTFKIYIGLCVGALPVIASLLAVSIFWQLGYLNSILGATLFLFFIACYLLQIKIMKSFLLSVSSQAQRWEKTAKRLFHDISNHLTVAQLRKDRMLDSLNKKSAPPSDYWQKEVYNLAKHLDSINSVISVTQKMNINNSAVSLLHDTPYYLKDMVEELLPLFSDRFLQKSINFNIDIDPSFKMHVDRGVLRDCVLTNVISNAVKFSEFNSEVTIKAYSRAGMKLIEIIDSGCGMNPEQIENSKSYDKNMSSVGTSGELGSGLGLPLIHEATEHLGGELEIISPLDTVSSTGTCFRLKFSSY